MPPAGWFAWAAAAPAGRCVRAWRAVVAAHFNVFLAGCMFVWGPASRAFPLLGGAVYGCVHMQQPGEPAALVARALCESRNATYEREAGGAAFIG